MAQLHVKSAPSLLSFAASTKRHSTIDVQVDVMTTLNVPYNLFGVRLHRTPTQRRTMTRDAIVVSFHLYYFKWINCILSFFLNSKREPPKILQDSIL